MGSATALRAWQKTHEHPQGVRHEDNMIAPGTIGFRLIAFALVWIAGALVAGGLLISSLFEDHVRRAFDARIEVLLETLVAVTDADPATGVRLLGAQGEPRFERPFSGWYWQISDSDIISNKIRLASRSIWDQTLALPSPPPAPGTDGLARYQIKGPRDQVLRVIERPISFAENGPRFRYAVAADIAEVTAELRPFRVALSWSLGLLGLGLILAVIFQVHFGLGPLRRLREALAHIRAGRAERIEGDYPGEVRPLVEEANQLIAQVSAVVERARTHVGNLAHALKTPLSVLAVEADKETGPLAEMVTRETTLMRERIDHHLSRARTAASARVIGQRTETGPVIAALARTLRRMHVDRKIMIDTLSDDFAFRGDAQDLEEMLGNLMDNACKWARQRVAITARAEGGRLIIIVEDDGPGLAPEDRARVLARGTRLDETVPGSGLGLDIVSEIAALYGGTLTLNDAALGGLRATLDLPAAIGPAAIG
ncbi:MAG: signal transduction histidine kinase [Alphaproteobacteria bacterium]